MFGVADETGELKYGECFIQCSSFGRNNSVRRKMQVITGKLSIDMYFPFFYYKSFII